MRKQEMHNTRGRQKKRVEDKEKDEGGQEREIEVVTDSEMEQQIGDKEQTEAIMDTEREIVEENAQGHQPDKVAARDCLLYTSHISTRYYSLIILEYKHVL